MKHSFLNTAFVLTAVVIATGATTFGDSKNRGGSGGFHRGQGGNQSGQMTGSFSGRLGKVSSGHGNGNGMSNGSVSQHKRNTLLHHGINQNTQHLNQANLNHLPGRLGDAGKSNSSVMLPSNHHNQNGHSGHTVLLSNGTKTKSIATNVAHLLKHNGHSVHNQPQIHNIVAAAPKHLCHQPHFSWWVNICHDHCHTNYGCWNIHNQYWDSWTPCNWQVVRCEQLSYYVGLNCTYIPDMQAYGVQSVNQGSPAQLSGLQAGDVILTVNGQPVFDPNLVNTELVRGRLDLQVIREGLLAPITLTVFPRLVQNLSF